MLESPSDDIDALLSIRPADMTDQQLETALALLMRYKAGWARDEAKRHGAMEPIPVVKAPTPSCEEDSE